MPIHDLFSNRTRPRPEKLIYDALPAALRQHCLRTVGQGVWNDAERLDRIDDVLQREHPVPSFTRAPILSLDGRPPRYTERFYEDCIKRGDFYEAMDAVEVAARLINTDVRHAARVLTVLKPDDALDEMNGRFVQYGVGYQFSKGHNRFVRVDSTFMHKEVTEPAMTLLTEKGFEGAAQEFDKAHQHYRQMVVDTEAGKDAVAWAVKAVESTAKAIMDARGWPYEKSDAIAKLLTKVVTMGLVPAALQSYFDGLRTALTSGIPTIGNAMARHGQGAKLKPIEEHMVTLAMHLAAATIRFLVEAHK